MAHSSVVLYIVLHIHNDPTLPLRLPQPKAQPQPSLASKPKPGLIIYPDGCDGLVIYYSMAKHKYLLWNPAIHCVLELPNPPQGVNFGCALCYIPSSKTYKIARFFTDKDKKGCDVLTPSPSMSWRQLVFPDIANANEGGKKEKASVFSAGGNVHFVVVTEVGKETDIKIVTLDVATECFTVNRLPNGAFKDMNYKKRKWCEKWIIRLLFLKERVYPLLNKQGEIWFLLENDKILAYSIDTQKTTEVHLPITFSGEMKIYPYKPSLVSIKGMEPDTILSMYRPRKLK